MNQEPITKQTEIHPEGGTYIEGNVQADRDFIGRDKHVTVHNPNPDRSSLYVAIVGIVSLVTLVVLTIIILQPRNDSAAPAISEIQATETPIPKFTNTIVAIETATQLPTSTTTSTPFPSITSTLSPTVTPQPTNPTASGQADSQTVEIAMPTPMVEADQVSVEFCSDELSGSSQLEREIILHTQAGLKALKILSGVQIESQITNDSNITSSHRVTTTVVGTIRPLGTPRYYPGDEPDTYCVSIVAELVEPERNE